MRLIARLSTYITLFLALMLPLRAQEREGVMGDLIRDVTGVETKIVGLAKALPDSAYEWRPGKGVRSTGEVFIHVARDNYFMPVLMGGAAPAETRIDAKGRHKTVEAFEKRTIQKAAPRRRGTIRSCSSEVFSRPHPCRRDGEARASSDPSE